MNTTPFRTVEQLTYPEVRFGGYSRVDGTVAFYSRVHALLETAKTVVDVGCGRGSRRDDHCAFRRNIADLRSPGRTVIGVDVDASGYQNSQIDSFLRIEDVENWPIDAASVDLIVSDYVIEHIGAPETFFGEIERVLKPGGYFCARTPNRNGYVAIASRFIPTQRHAAVLARVQSDRKAEDVFPTHYRCNTRATLRRELERAGLEFVLIPIEGEPNYLSVSPMLYRIAASVHRYLPDLLKSTFLVFARKP